MKITLFMAMSVNGMIAAEDGGEEFLSDANWQTFASLVHEFGNFITGSKTYEVVGSWDEDYSFEDFQDAKKIIVSDNPDYKLQDGYQLANSPHDAIAMLKEAGFEKGLLEGGSNLNASFAAENLIDEILLNIEPVLVGKGVPLFHPKDFQLKLELADSRTIEGGIIQLRYQVIS